MAKRRRDPSQNVDAEDLNQLFSQGFVSLEEIDSKDLSCAQAEAKKTRTMHWDVVKVPKIRNLAPPVPSSLPDSKWAEYGLPRELLAGILDKGYAAPTEIQKQVLNHIAAKELVGSAPTGSGKTLAFSLSFLSELCKDANHKGLHTLVLCPTRELAVQVADHIKCIGKYIQSLRVVCIVGGMSEEKQQRLLSKLAPTVIVATPGRLAEMAEFDQDLQRGLKSLLHLIIDEADRMVMDKRGGFPDLEAIFRYMLLHDKRISLFSATLSTEKLKASFGSLKRRLGIKKPVQVHIAGSLEGLLQERKVCVTHPIDKDKWLYVHLLARSSGKCIVFVNSIEAVRRLHLVLSLLLPHHTICPLHAQMQQRQRLKYLDRFRHSANGVMVCSDVAARGLDIPLVDTVVQFEPPRNLDTHRHRTGRTARAGSPGSAILVLSPKDAVAIKQSDDLQHLLKLPEGGARHPDDHLRDLFDLVYRIEHLVFLNRKAAKEHRLLGKAAEDLGGGDELDLQASFQSNKQLAALKAQLLGLLKH